MTSDRCKFSKAFTPYILAIVASLLFTVTTEAKTVLVLGDSISAAYGIDEEEGWVNLLQYKLAQQGDFKVVNASISGDTTGAGLARLPLLLEQHSPEIVIIELGGNDGLRGFPLKIMKENLATMVTLAKSAGAKVLLLGMQIPPNYGERYTQGFFTAFQEVAKNTGVTLMPFFIESVVLIPNLMQDDGIHPTAEAQPRLLEDVWPYIEDLLKK